MKSRWKGTEIRRVEERKMGRRKRRRKRWREKTEPNLKIYHYYADWCKLLSRMVYDYHNSVFDEATTTAKQKTLVTTTTVMPWKSVLAFWHCTRWLDLSVCVHKWCAISWSKDVTIYQFKYFRVSGKLCLFTKFRTEIPQTLEPKSVGGFSYLSWLTFGLHELKTDSVCVAHTRTFPQWTSMSVLSFVMLMKFFSSLCLFVCSRTWNSGKSRLLVVKVMLSTFSIRSAAKYNP